MKNRTKYIIIFLLTFILYGNTLFHEYALDDALVITENEYVLSGFEGIDDLFTHEFFSGFFDEKNKSLVAGGRYRPLSMVTFAIEWQIVMGSPYDGIAKVSLEKRMNQNASSDFILPSQKLMKDLLKTIHTEDRSLRKKQQKSILNNTNVFQESEKRIILSNLRKMHSKRKLILFISHFLNVFLFSITALVLFILLELLLSNYNSDKWYLSVPFVTILIFIVHPIHTEVVANIKGRDEILSLLGALIAVLFSLKYLQNQKKLYLVLSFIFFSIALFSKEVAITFLAIIPIAIYFFREKQGVKNVFIVIIPIVVASIIYFYVRGKVIGGFSFETGTELMNNSFLGMTVSERFATVFYTLLLYLKLIIIPHPLTYDYYPYHIPIMTWGNIWPIISFIVYLFLGIYAILGLKKKGIVAFGIFFFLITLSPMSNILFPIGVFMNERFVFTASIGIIIILAYVVSYKLPNKVKNTVLIQYFLLTVLLVYSVKTISRNSVWKNDFTLFTNDVNTSVNSAKSNTAAGGILIEEATKPGNEKVKKEYLEKSIKYLRKAIDIHPTYNDAILLMGNAQWEYYEDLDSTFKYYERILQRVPLYDIIYTNLFETRINTVFEEENRVNENLILLHKLEKYNPNNFHVNYLLGRIYGRYANNLEKSKAYLEKAAAIDPSNITVYKDLGVAYGISKDFEKSANALLKATELDPNDPVLKLNLIMTYANLNDMKKALVIMDEVYEMEIKPAEANILINLGTLYRNTGNQEKYKQCIFKAQKLNPELFKND
jgi:tetratricopeptide (TPR) repeat protein